MEIWFWCDSDNIYWFCCDKKWIKDWSVGCLNVINFGILIWSFDESVLVSFKVKVEFMLLVMMFLFKENGLFLYFRKFVRTRCIIEVICDCMIFMCIVFK